MSKRIKTPQSQGRDYKQMLKYYFGRFLYGLEVTHEGGQVQAQIVYFDFKHIETVGRELAQMMPEVVFTKLKRDFTEVAQQWALARMLEPGYKYQPVLYVQQGDTLVKTTVRDIARSELNQLEIDDDDPIDYDHSDDITFCCREENLREHAWD
jgi:hypothetical protein